MESGKKIMSKQLAFFSSPFCGICPKMREVADKLVKKHNYKFYAIDTEAQAKVARELNVKLIPQIIVGESDSEDEMFNLEGVRNRYIGLMKYSDIKL